MKKLILATMMIAGAGSLYSCQGKETNEEGTMVSHQDSVRNDKVLDEATKMLNDTNTSAPRDTVPHK